MASGAVTEMRAGCCSDSAQTARAQTEEGLRGRGANATEVGEDLIPGEDSQAEPPRARIVFRHSGAPYCPNTTLTTRSF